MAPTETSCHPCAGETLEAAFLGNHGDDLLALRIANPKIKTELYEIVADGAKFGIAFRNEVVIHGMELDRARTTVSILNEVLEFRKAS